MPDDPYETNPYEPQEMTETEEQAFINRERDRVRAHTTLPIVLDPSPEAGIILPPEDILPPEEGGE